MTMASRMEVLGRVRIGQHVQLWLDTPLRTAVPEVRHDTDDAHLPRILAPAAACGRRRCRRSTAGTP